MGGRIRWALPASTRNQLWLTGLFLALLALFMMTGARAFLAWPMYESLLSTLPLYGFLALGLTLVVAAGEMDLCFPSTLAIAGFGFALTAIHTGQVWLGVIVAILIGLGIGLCNGFLVAYVGVPSIIATIGTQFFWRGAVMLLSQGLALGLADLGGSPTHSVLAGRLGGFLPMQSLWLIVMALALWLLLNRHPLGDAIRFTGEQADIASRLGINVPAARLGVHTLMGGIAGFAGAIGCMEMGSWWPTQGDGYMLLVFAAVFIGGTSIRRLREAVRHVDRHRHRRDDRGGHRQFRPVGILDSRRARHGHRCRGIELRDSLRECRRAYFASGTVEKKVEPLQSH